MASYFIAQVSIQDREAYQAHEQGFMAILDQYGGQLVSVDEQPLVLEGNWGCTRTVLLKFETAEAERLGTAVMPIRRWRKFAFRAPSLNIVMVQGFITRPSPSVVAFSTGCCAVCHGGVIESVN